MGLRVIVRLGIQARFRSDLNQEDGTIMFALPGYKTLRMMPRLPVPCTTARSVVHLREPGITSCLKTADDSSDAP